MLALTFLDTVSFKKETPLPVATAKSQQQEIDEQESEITLPAAKEMVSDSDANIATNPSLAEAWKEARAFQPPLSTLS